MPEHIKTSEGADRKMALLPVLSAIIATILSTTGCQESTSNLGTPQWVPTDKNIGLDGAPWDDAECQKLGSILWGFMNEPRKLGYLGADVTGTIQSIRKLYQTIDTIDNKKHTLADIQEALNNIDALIKNNIKEDALDSRVIREEVYEYGKKLAYMKSIFQRHREIYFQGKK